MPPYKLLVEYQRKELDRRFRRFIADNEVVRDEPFNFNLKMTNIGTDPFPGGTIGAVRLETTALLSLSISWNMSQLDAISPIAPKGLYETGLFSVPAVSWEGPTRLVVNAKSLDGQPLELYWTQGGRPYAGDWIHVMYAVGRENVLALDLLDKILRRLDTQQKKDT